MKDFPEIESVWNPVGVRYFLPIPTQCALCDTGLWSGTALQFIPVRSASIKEGGFSNPPIRRGKARLAQIPVPFHRFQHLAFTPTALNSRAQRREAHAGLPITHMTEPQRGSTKGAVGANCASPSVLL